MSRKKRKKSPMETVIHPMNYKRLFAFLRALAEVPNQNFEPGLIQKLKGLYYEDGGEWFEEGKICEKAAFLTTGVAYGHYYDRILDQVVFKIFKPGELIINADSFFNNIPSNFSVSLCPGANLMYITQADLKDLFRDVPEVMGLVIKAVSALHRDTRERDEMLHLKGRKRIVRFFTIYPALLMPARQARMMYKDISSYLHMSIFNFSKLIKKLFPQFDQDS